LAAAALVLGTPGADDAALTAARSATAPALRRLAGIRSQYDDGAVTTAEHDAVLAEIAEFAHALGPDGAPLREALGDCAPRHPRLRRSSTPSIIRETSD